MTGKYCAREKTGIFWEIHLGLGARDAHDHSAHASPADLQRMITTRMKVSYQHGGSLVLGWSVIPRYEKEMIVGV